MNIVKANKVRSEIEKFMLADGMDQVIDLEKSHGVWLVDGRDKREYLDLFSMLINRFSQRLTNPLISHLPGAFFTFPNKNLLLTP